MPSPLGGTKLARHSEHPLVEFVGPGKLAERVVAAEVQRMYNWVVEAGTWRSVSRSSSIDPKPPRVRSFTAPGGGGRFAGAADEQPGPLLDFLKLTGCRPIEARKLEARHVRGRLDRIPAGQVQRR